MNKYKKVAVMKKIGIMTLGCRVNQYESDAIKEEFEKRGYSVTGAVPGCDLYIVNTCTVTAESDAKCRKTIRRLARLRDESGASLAVIGCFSQGAPENEVLSLADFVIGNREKMSVVEKADEIISKAESGGVKTLAGAEYEKMNISRSVHAKAYVKIEDGCNNFCTYCFVPYVRGRVRSREAEEIICEIHRLEENGYNEIILTGIETASYGEDLKKQEALCKLIEEICEKTGVTRIRLGSMYPSFFTPERCRRLALCKPVLPHFHLSVQSASTNVLARMKRGYDREGLYEAVKNIRSEFPDAALSCDVICGFPGESEEDFDDSRRFIKEAEILHAHIFPYSKREGTKAPLLDGQVDEKIKHGRAALLKKEAEETRDRVLLSMVGKEVSVLVEKIRDGFIFGYTEHFVYVKARHDGTSCVGNVIKFKLEKENLALSEDTEN